MKQNDNKPKVKKISFSKLITFILLTSAIVLGYNLYSQSKVTAVDPDATVAPVILPSSQKTVLDTPNENSSEEEKREYENLVRAQAEESSFLDLTDCLAVPKVLKIKNNSPIKIKNSSDKEHAIVLTEKQEHSIATGKEISITFEFFNGPGVYAYGCDRSPRPVGIFLVE